MEERKRKSWSWPQITGHPIHRRGSVYWKCNFPMNFMSVYWLISRSVMFSQKGRKVTPPTLQLEHSFILYTICGASIWLHYTLIRPFLTFSLTLLSVAHASLILLNLFLGAWLFKTQLHPYNDKILLEAQGRGVTNKFIKERF